MDQKQRPLVELLFQVEILFLERFFNVNWGELGKVELQDSPTAYNTVYVGVKGAPEASTINAPKMISNIPSTEKVAEKPFLVEEDGKWFVYVPLVWLRGFRWEHGWCFILFFLFASKSVQKSPGGLNFNHFNNFSIFRGKKTIIIKSFFWQRCFPPSGRSNPLFIQRPQVPRITSGDGIINDIEWQIPIEEMQLV